MAKFTEKSGCNVLAGGILRKNKLAAVGISFAESCGAAKNGNLFAAKTVCKEVMIRQSAIQVALDLIRPDS